MAYTPTVYTATADSPPMNAANMNKSENGIKDAHLIATPVDCASRVAEYTGDGIPLIPDNTAGTTARLNNFTAIPSGFNVNAGTPTSTFANGIWKIVADSTAEGYSRASTAGCVVIKLRVLSGTLSIGFSGNTRNITGDVWRIEAFYSSTSLSFLQYSSSATWEVADIYIGTGVYDAPAKDRAGNGNDMALYSITPVNGKFGKEMSFNGSSSYAQATSPVIGTTGTISVRFKINALGASQVVLDNRDGSGYNGVMILITSTGAINIDLRGASGSSHSITPTQTITVATYNSVDVTFSSNQMIIYLNGVAISTSTISITATTSVTNLQIGMRNAAAYLNGVISHLRYDSRIWTADEARAWSLNPISIDSRV